MKKILVLILLLITVGCSCQKKEIKNDDAVKFKEEYEKYNGEKTDSGFAYPVLDIAKKNPIKYKTEEQLVDIIENKTGVIYLGFPTCPWCRNAIPVLLEAAEETGLKTIYYLNVKDIRDEKKLENGEIKTINEGTDGYKKLVNALYEQLDEYDGLNDSKIKRIYVPIVIFVKEGEVVAVHKNTVSSQTNPYVVLDEKQKKELKKIYKENIYKIADDLCDSSC